jgi:hypothetical protein
MLAGGTWLSVTAGAAVGVQAGEAVGMVLGAGGLIDSDVSLVCPWVMQW